MSATFKLNLDALQKSVNRISTNLPQYTKGVLADAQLVLLVRIQSLAPKKTGKYAKSWKLGKTTGNKTEVFTDEGKLYAILEFQGANPGIRTPKQAKAIRFETSSGEIVFTMKVDWPGFKAIPHVRPAMRRVMNIMMRDVMFANLDKASTMFVEASKPSKQKVQQFKSKKP